MASLATVADVESLLQEDLATADEAYVTTALSQAQAMVDAYCDQPLMYTATVTDVLEADHDDEYLYLRFPVVAVASVVEDTDTLTVTDDYRWYEDGRLRRMSGDYSSRWSSLPDAVTAVYSAGYDTGGPGVEAPDDLILAVALVTQGLFNTGRVVAEQGAQPIKSIKLDGSDSITYAEEAAPAGGIDAGELGGLSAQVKALLAPYRRRIL